MYRQNKDVIFRQEEDEAILFNPDTSDTIVINSTGCFIWSLLDGKRTKEDIVSEMVRAYDASVEKLKDDFTKYIADLEARNFIEKVS